MPAESSHVGGYNLSPNKRLVLGSYRDNGKEAGNYYFGFRVQGLYWGNIGVILGLFRDNEKDNGSYCNIVGYILSCCMESSSFLSPRALNLKP